MTLLSVIGQPHPASCVQRLLLAEQVLGLALPATLRTVLGRPVSINDLVRQTALEKRRLIQREPTENHGGNRLAGDDYHLSAQSIPVNVGSSLLLELILSE